MPAAAADGLETWPTRCSNDSARRSPRASANSSDSPPSNIASYPFKPADADLRRIRHQLDMEKPGEEYVEGEEFDYLDADPPAAE